MVVSNDGYFAKWALELYFEPIIDTLAMELV